MGRLRALDARPVNLDGFAFEAPELGLVAMHSPRDPEPSLVIADGTVVEMDGRARGDFDLIDSFIADRGLDLEVAPEAMAIAPAQFARLLCDMDTPREELTRLAGGMTPAQMACVMALLRPAELQMAMAKMRVRRTPSIQAHVTNRLDDPLLLAADAATAVAFGFRELETTVPLLGDAASNALAVLIGAQVGRGGALTQCSVEEALELELGMRGLTTYAETVSIYGTEAVFIDGDDTPWSKAFLTSAYASRGLKMRVTSGAGAEVLMGATEGCSMLYLESRCVSLARAMGTQGVQNGGIDGASVAASVPEGMKELLAENLMVMIRDMESCSGNDTMVSESDIRRTAHTVPVLFAGSDFIFSGYGSIPRYDNAFAISNFNAEDLDDYLVLQRDWGVDGGLRPQSADQLAEVRRRAAEAAGAVYADLGLAEFPAERVDEVVAATDSRGLSALDPSTGPRAAAAVLANGVDALDVVRSLTRTGFAEEADRLAGLISACAQGDHLQTAAIFDEDLNVLSKLTDPNDYVGPGTGYQLSPERRAEIVAVRQQRSTEDLLAVQMQDANAGFLSPRGPALRGDDPREVCVGLSPAFGVKIWRSLSGLGVRELLAEVLAGIADAGGTSRVLRVPATIDLGAIGLSAARHAGSGIGIGLQGKGTALIHRHDLAPLANLELLSVAPQITRAMYRQLGVNAALHAQGLNPTAIFVPGTEEAITARYHSSVVALVSIEKGCVVARAPAEDLEVHP